MKITLNWLKDHLDTSASVDDIAKALVSLGHEVESIDDPAVRLKYFVVADVVGRTQHPNADRLSLCQVDDGSGKTLQVVCGAPNVRSGLKVIFAREGVVIPSTGQALKKGVIRGIESSGMICSAEELMLGSESDGIIELQTSLPAGSSACEALGLHDAIIEVSLTPNRADCFSVRGLARDLAAIGVGSLKPLEEINIPSSQPCAVNISLKTPHCVYFTSRVIEGVSNKNAPEWIKNRLIAVGQRSISPIVDITNYICLDIGQPLHAYDLNMIQHNITVRSAQDGEDFESLKDENHKLSEGMVVIADDQRVLSLGGIMGGKTSSCTESTTSIFLESACFDAERIAITGQKLSILSDSRTRLERGVDPELRKYSLDIATNYILNICGGQASKAIECGTQPDTCKQIKLPLQCVAYLLGTTIEKGKILNILKNLGFTILSHDEKNIEIKSPSWRHDIQGEIDLIEEIARIYGYDNIPPASLPPHDIRLLFDQNDQVRRLLAARGLHEVISWSFTDKAEAVLFGNVVELSLSGNTTAMRPSVLHGLIKATLMNQNKSQPNQSFFEIGHTYQNINNAIVENSCIATIRTQQTHEKHWLSSPCSVDVYDTKADAMAILQVYGVSLDACQIEATGPSYYHPGRVGTIKQGNKTLGYFGEVHPNVLKYFDIKGPVVACEIINDSLAGRSTKKQYNIKLSPYQAVERDFAFIVEHNVHAAKLITAIKKADKDLIQNIDIFDVYEGNKLPDNKKSIALRVRLQHAERTLTDDDLNTLSQKIIDIARSSCGAEIRSE